MLLISIKYLNKVSIFMYNVYKIRTLTFYLISIIKRSSQIIYLALRFIFNNKKLDCLI